jgi:hypothetical protein
MGDSRLMRLCAIAVVAGLAAPAVEAVAFAASSAATVTATPPSHAAVKPLTAVQARERRCAQQARQHAIPTPSTQAYVAACMKHRIS